jgi:ATP-dependent Clp protease ATP-binding subunit ClpC
VFEGFTERARQVVVLAREQARALKHNYIGTEHLLLGLLAEQEGLAASVLGSLGVTLEQARDQVVQMIGRGEELVGEELVDGMAPFTPRAKKTLELALRERLELGQREIDTEHILLGLLRENEGVASRILRERFDLHSQRIRREVQDRIRQRADPRVSQAGPRASEPDRLVLQFELAITPPPAGEIEQLHLAVAEAIKRVYEDAGATVHHIARRPVDRWQS